MSEPYNDCPRFQRCAVNRCPLAANYQALRTHPMDSEKRCKLGKHRRIEIASRYPGVLVYDGLSGKEHAASQREIPRELVINKARGFARNPAIPE